MHSLFIQQVLSYVETDETISLPMLRSIVLHVGFPLESVFHIQHSTDNKIKGTAIPHKSKHELLSHIQKAYNKPHTVTHSQPQTKQNGGFLVWNSHIQSKYNDLRDQYFKIMNSDVFQIEPSKMSFYDHFKLLQLYTQVNGLLAGLVIILTFWLYHIRIHPRENHASKLIRFFNKQQRFLPHKRVDPVLPTSSTESYNMVHPNLQHIDVQLHELFKLYTHADNLRYHLFQFRKTHHLFHGRGIYNEHLVRVDGTVRESCGEIARAIQYYWKYRDLLGVFYQKTRQLWQGRSLPMTKKKGKRLSGMKTRTQTKNKPKTKTKNKTKPKTKTKTNTKPFI